MKSIKKILVANRGEIAIRVFRAASELQIATVAVYTEEDKLSLHRFKADESYLIGKDLGPVKAYLSIEEMVRVACLAGCDAIHPGYGFLSERPEFVDACDAVGLIFIGPPADVIRRLGNKVSARQLAEQAQTPVMPATGPLGDDFAKISREAEAIGYPLMLKASWGGGGRGMRVINSPDVLEREVLSGRREAEAAFGNGEVYLEKLVERARHVEVQLLGDQHGNIVHLWERDCSVQRRNQKVVERAPAPYLDEHGRATLCQLAVNLAKMAGYQNAGTAEFLQDIDSGAFYFIEVNPRIQVEHTVTEEVTGVDIVKAQIGIARGGRIGVVEETGVPEQEGISLHGHALQCRITTEDPEANFVPDYGRISAYRGATGFGIRLDGGTAYSGAVITRYYDSLLEKVTAWASTDKEVIRRMDRALREFRIRGVATNLNFVESIINHKDFVDANYTTRFIDQTPELFEFTPRQDRATKLLNFIANVTVNGNEAVQGRAKPRADAIKPLPPSIDSREAPVPGSRNKLLELGPEKFSQWLLAQKKVCVTDTTMRDGHQSLIATRMRTYDMVAMADAYARIGHNLFSIECWGGATFDVAMRFLHECPWRRLTRLREKIPNILLQMLLRGANGVGYRCYPDNVVESFTRRAAESGIDLFRVFDSLNWLENMKVGMNAVLESGTLLEGTICYTGDILDPKRRKYDLDYYVNMALELKKFGCHIIGLKDMAGLLKPEAAKMLIPELKAATNLPVHFHTHDTSGISAATVLAAVAADVDVFDAAFDSFSGLTSQPNLGSLVAALKNGPRDPELDFALSGTFSNYWEQVRHQYAAFESDLRFGASEVYLHEMPGGQFTNLKEQARALGLEARWHEVAQTYADVNNLFGDIVKVTPTSKVVGDMALFMVSTDLSSADVLDPKREISFPESVVSYFKGDLGQPLGGFPAALRDKVLNGQKAIDVRPGSVMPSADLQQERENIERELNQKISDEEFNAYLMYPKVFTDFMAHTSQYSAVDILPTPVFFYGMQVGEEIAIDLEPGKRLFICLLAIGEADEEGYRKVFFELNGQPRTIRIVDQIKNSTVVKKQQAEPGNALHVAAPMPGMVSTLSLTAGQKVAAGDVLLTIEAMKMETAIHAERTGVIDQVLVSAGQKVDAKDLLVVFAAA